MEDSFVTEKELENFLKKEMRQYTTGVHEDGNSEINNVKNNAILVLVRAAEISTYSLLPQFYVRNTRRSLYL